MLSQHSNLDSIPTGIVTLRTSRSTAQSAEGNTVSCLSKRIDANGSAINSEEESSEALGIDHFCVGTSKVYLWHDQSVHG